ncbi:MAG TPA: radical SAM protein, partial [Bacteroidales bacterium]|nr:radical SAM protein [Bacteroidales bacterium]
MKKKKLLLINPGGKDFRHNKFYEPIELGIVASLVTDPNWEVKIVDLRFEDTDLPEADIVALSSRIIDINTTYEIIRHYKTKGIKTVIGGTHATLCPDEAQKYADVVVIGEAEGVLMQILKDFENGTLKKIYKGCTDLKYTVNRNYYKHYYKTATLQLSRGCPLACDFCCVGKIHNRTHRYRDFKDVVSEIKKTKQKLLFFTDENMYGFSSKNRETVLSFFNEMITQKVNKHWIGMASINAGIDDEFLSLARKSGCIMLLIGFEAIEEDTLTSINKKLNAKLIHDYDRIIKNIHKHRIAVCGAFMLGLPTDNERVIKKRTEFIVKSKIDV